MLIKRSKLTSLIIAQSNKVGLPILCTKKDTTYKALKILVSLKMPH